MLGKVHRSSYPPSYPEFSLGLDLDPVWSICSSGTIHIEAATDVSVIAYQKRKNLLSERRDTGGGRVCTLTSKPAALQKTRFRSLFPLAQALPLALQPYRTKKSGKSLYRINSRPPALPTELLSYWTRAFRQRLQLQRSEEHSQESAEGAAGRSPAGLATGTLAARSASCCQVPAGTVSTRPFCRSSRLTWIRALIFGLQAVAIQGLSSYLLSC